MAYEGGVNAHRTCIPKSQNSGAQGRVLARFVRQCKPKLNDQFVLRIRGGCELRNRLVKRDGPSGHVLSKRQGVATTFDASSNQLRVISPNDTYVYVPLADLQSGSIALDMKYDAEGAGGDVRIQRMEVIDSDGDLYFSTESPITGTIAFDVDDVDEANPVTAGLIVDTNRSITVSYSATASVVENSTSSATRVVHSRGNMGMDWILAILVLGGMTGLVL